MFLRITARKRLAPVIPAKNATQTKSSHHKIVPCLAVYANELNGTVISATNTSASFIAFPSSDVPRSSCRHYPLELACEQLLAERSRAWRRSCEYLFLWT